MIGNGPIGATPTASALLSAQQALGVSVTLIVAGRGAATYGTALAGQSSVTVKSLAGPTMTTALLGRTLTAIQSAINVLFRYPLRGRIGVATQTQGTLSGTLALNLTTTFGPLPVYAAGELTAMPVATRGAMSAGLYLTTTLEAP